jgi:hypothetical protein
VAVFPLKDIASEFDFQRTGSILTTIKKLQSLMGEDKRLVGKIDSIKRQYDTRPFFY